MYKYSKAILNHGNVSDCRGTVHSKLTARPAVITQKLQELPLPSSSTAHLSRSPPHAPPIDYASSAPVPPSGSNGHKGDEEVPYHLYDRLPEHLMTTDEKGRKVPDYLKMILMCEPNILLRVTGVDHSAKVYSKPLSLPETPLTYAANLSARFGNEVCHVHTRSPC